MSAASTVIEPAGVAAHCADTASAVTVAEGWDCHVHVFDAAAPVRGGHYQPAHHPLQAIEQRAALHGINHLVLVQPSVYGCDNSVMLWALESSQRRHRGVAVVEPAVTDRELDRLHAAGVRGVRFNLVSPVGYGGDAAGDAAADVERLTPRLRERGWYVQWYVRPGDLTVLVPLQARTGLLFVLDHLAGMHAGLPDDIDAAALPAGAEARAAWSALGALALGGAWIKLSGWYRLGAQAPYPALYPTVRRIAQLFGPRMVWGSDWPHTSFALNQTPPYASTLEPLRAALGHAALLPILGEQARSLHERKIAST